MIKIKAIIMSGGMGTRLRPLTCSIPKPMVPIMNKPVMEYSIELLKKHGINDIGVTLYYLPSSIINHFGDGESYGVKMNYFIEDSPLGTGGSVKNANDFLDTTFIVVSGDAFTNMDIQKAIAFHRKKRSKATLVLKRETIPLEYGVIIIDKNNRITRFLEKPNWGEVFSDTINTGIYILEPEVLNYYKKGERFDFSKDLFPRLLKDNVPMFGYVTEDYWNDIGDINSYVKTHMDILNSDVKVNLKNKEVGEGIWIGDNTVIEGGVKIIPPVYIGNNCTIKRGTVINSYTVIGDNSYVEENCSLKRTIAWNSVYLSKGLEARKSIICDYVQVKENVKLYEGSVIGSSSAILSRAIVNPNVKVWPHKLIESDVTLEEDLVWGSKASKNIFGSRSIRGNMNIEINLEFATRLGSVFATVMGIEGISIVCSDEHSSSKLIKNSIISGIMATGTNVIDIKNNTLPICRFAVRYFNANSGIYISSNPKDVNTIQIELINKNGANINKNLKRKIENMLGTSDFIRCNGENIGQITEIHDFYSIYIEEGKRLLKNISIIKRKNPKVLISTYSKDVFMLAREYLEGIGCQVVQMLEFHKEIDFDILSREVVKNSFDLGIFYSENGEKMTLIDDKGRILDEEKILLLSIIMGFKTGELKDTIIPYNFPRIVENVVKDYNGVMHITKTNIADILDEIVKRDSLYQYFINYDAIWGTGVIIDYIVKEKVNLSKIIDELPNYHYVKHQVDCPWEEKGRILRRIIEDDRDVVETIEGARIVKDKGWVLILPDEERPQFNIYAEGASEEYAEELSNLYYEKIAKILNSKTL